MAVKVDDVIGVSGFMKPGAMVDVSDRHRAAARSGVDAKTPSRRSSSRTSRCSPTARTSTSRRTSARPSRVTRRHVQVTPEQAEKLALAAIEGKLRLVMRNGVDQGDEQTPGADKNTLLTGERATARARAGRTQERAARAAAPRPSSQRRRRAPRAATSAEPPRPRPRRRPRRRAPRSR